jgi:galactose oxidase
VLVWSAYLPNDFLAGKEPKTQTAFFNPATSDVTGFEVTVTNHDMFCPGISMLASGDIVVTGGSNAEKTSIFDASEANWRPGPNMNNPRGYQASTILSNGEVRVHLNCIYFIFLCSASPAAAASFLAPVVG